MKVIDPMTTGASLVVLVISAAAVFAAEAIDVKNQTLDKATLHVETIPKDREIRVELFSTTGADLGKTKHRDIAELLAESAPPLLAADIVEVMRETGFSNVVLGNGEESAASSPYLLSGRFTVLNPGSQAARAWIGFGAGESRVCVEGRLADGSDTTLGTFSHCRKGLGWGKSDNQVEASATRIGDSIALFMLEWANGEFAR